MAKKTRKGKSVSYAKEKVILAEEQTLLSKERTVLSFMRTGLAFTGAGLVIVNVFPENFPSQVVGWALVVIGLIEIAESYRRLNKYKRKMEKVKQELGKDI